MASASERVILVAGATGELGGRVARRLLDLGASVRALVRPGADAAELATRGAKLVEGDFRAASSSSPPPGSSGSRTRRSARRRSRSSGGWRGRAWKP